MIDRFKRNVIRLTLVKGYNFVDPEGYAKLIEKYRPMFVEAKGYVFVGHSQSRLEVKNMPYHHEIMEFAKKIEENSSYKVIDGKKEANIIFSTHIEKQLNPNMAYLYIDVGGGSTELTLFHKNEPVEERSFNIGTIRILNNLVTEIQWNEIKQWTRLQCLKYKDISAIGSGGNINKIFRLSGKKDKVPLSYKKLISISNSIRQYSFEERIYKLGLRPDRADVILPAAKIFTSVMGWGDIKQIYVPQIGLADGLVNILYNRYIS